MIFMLMGRPGGGKSYEAVRYHIIPAIKEGRKIVTNMPLNLLHFRLIYGDAADLIEIVTPSKNNPVPFSTMVDYGDTWYHPETGVGPLYVIDECHKPLRRGKTRQDVEEWFAEHRHSKSDVLLISQYHRKLDLNICDLIDVVYSVGKTSAFGSQESYVRHTKTGIRGTTLNTDVRSYDPAYYPFYRSHTASTSFGKEAVVKDIKPIWKKWQFVGAALFLVAGVIMLIFAVPKMFAQPDIIPSVSLNPEPDTFSALSSQFDSFAQLNDPDQVNTGSTLPATPGAIPQSQPHHPFSEFQLRLSGYVNAPSGRIIVFRALQNGQSAFMLTDKDLIDAGYELDLRGECLVHVQHQRYTAYITCGAPSQSIQAPL